MSAASSAAISIPSKWTSLIGKEEDIDDNVWIGSAPPVELSKLPENSELPPKLLEILQWSLDRHTADPAATERAPSSSAPADQGRRNDGGVERVSIAAESHELGADTISLTSSTRLASKADTVAAAFRRIKALRARHAARIAHRAKLSKTRNAPVLAECTSCFDELPVSSLIRLNCTHYYCKGCLSTLIMTAIQIESSFPPKCCLTEIPLNSIVKFLDQKQLSQYKVKAAEYSVPADRRFYCPSAVCGRWIPPSKVRSSSASSKCPSCSTKICTQCRGQVHANNVDCPQDRSLEATMTLAEAHGWKRCYRCRALVERARGCIHMTCTCSAQFCYVCNAVWRTCSCTEADELNRQAELDRRRLAARREQEEEDEHLRRSMAIISQIEAKAAQQRLRREAEEAELLRIELQQLARLEQERLEEEELRRQEQWALEQELRQILEASLQMESKALVDGMMEVIRLHHIMLDDKHGREEQELIGKYEAATQEHQQRSNSVTGKLKGKVDGSLEDLKDQHGEEKHRLLKQHEEQADELFMKIQLYLKDKSNKEEREKKMLQELKDTQEAEQLALETQLCQDYQTAKAVKQRELDLLSRATDSKLAKAKALYEASMRQLIFRTSLERKWYIAVSERRLEMVKQHNQIMAEELARGWEPVGLIAERAASILPLPACDVGALGPKILDDFVRSPVEPLVAKSTSAAEQRQTSRPTSQSSFSFISAQEGNSDKSTTHLATDVESSYSDTMPTDLSVGGGDDLPPARSTKFRARRLTPPEDRDMPNNGPAWVRAKRGEPSIPRFSLDLPDVPTPPSPPDSPVLRPAMPQDPRKRVGMFIRDGPISDSLTPDGSIQRPSLITQVPTGNITTNAPRAWSYFNDAPPRDSKTSRTRLFRTTRMNKPNLSEKQRQKARSTSWTVQDCVTGMANTTIPPSPSVESVASTDIKLKHKASRIWPFKKKIVLP